MAGGDGGLRMGTNYYHHANEPRPPCDCCGRPFDDQPDHIGKASAGWMFSWCGLRHRSVAEWEAALRAGGRIVDEYGEPMEVEKFIAYARGKIGRRQYDAVMAEHPGIFGRPPPEGREWLDAEGHSFSACEFF